MKKISERNLKIFKGTSKESAFFSILKIKEKLTFPCPHLHSGENQRIAQRFVEPA